MIIGMLIGFMLVGILLAVFNVRVSHLNTAATIRAQRILYIIGASMFIIATCALIGLLIRGA